MTMRRNLVVMWLLPSLVVGAGVPEVAPAASLPDISGAPEVVDRVSDTYTLEAYLWRDFQPLIITGDLQSSLGFNNCTGLQSADYSCMQATGH